MVKIVVTPTSFRVATTFHQTLCENPLSIFPYTKMLNELKWDFKKQRMVIYKRYYYRNPTDDITFFPKYDLPRFLRFLKSHNVEYEIQKQDPPIGKDVNIPIQSWYKPRNSLQTEAIDFITKGEGWVRGLSLQPGAGKTSISLVSAALLGKRVLIKTPILMNQWENAIHKFLDLKKEDVYVISGKSSILYLIEAIDKEIFPKIIIASLQTLRAYAQKEPPYDSLLPIENLLEHIGVGTVISDEVHLHFHTNLMLDLMLNARVHIPMTATYEVTEKQIAPIFNGHYPPNIRFGEDRYEKYVHVSAYFYDLPYQQIPASKFRTVNGYNHSLMEKFFLKKKKLFDQVIEKIYYPILEAEYFSQHLKGEKLLIIVSLIEMCEYLCKIFRNDYPDKVVNKFVGKTHEKVKEESDIIIATAKSAGVGFDVPHLLTTFVTIPIDSPPLNKQLLGRLRKLDNRCPRLAYVTCRQLDSHMSYARTRSVIFPNLAAEFKEQYVGHV